MKELQQRIFFVTKHHIIKRGGIESHKQSLETNNSIFIPFSDIDDRRKVRVFTEKYPAIFYIGIFIVLLGLVRTSLFLDDTWVKALTGGGLTVLLGCVIMLIYRFLQIKYFIIQLEDDKHFFLIHNSPNQEVFEQFVDAIFEARKRNYREHYFFINEENDKKTELSRMKWLLKEHIITDEEYEDIIDEINLRFM